MSEGYNYDAADSIHRISRYEFADFEPDFNTVVIDKRAKLTDLISSSPIPNAGLLVSERFLKLLQSFKLQPHRIYPLPVVYKDQPLTGYFWLHLPQRASLMEAKSIQEVEEGCENDPLLNGVAMLKLYRPMTMAYCWVNSELKAAILDAGITGVKLS